MFENKILIASDFTPTSAAAEVAAFNLAHRLGVKLVIVHVIPERSTHGLSTIPPELAEPRDLNEQLQSLGKAEAPEADRVLARGEPAETIVRIAEEESVDLIILGSQGRTGLSRAILGSVAEAVSRQSPLPVMLVKPTVDA